VKKKLTSSISEIDQNQTHHQPTTKQPNTFSSTMNTVDTHWNDWNSHMTPGVYNPPKIGCHYSQLPVTLSNPKNIVHVIGEDGKVFKAITKRFNGCLYIWYDSEKNVIEFWSKSTQTAIRVRNALIERIQYIEDKVE
jgi:hypothetical protein